MRYIKGFYMSLGMFSNLPLPFHIWDEKLTAVMVSAFPLVGAIIGVLWWAVASILLMPRVPLIIVAAALTVTPFFLAGFIHLDGYMDTSDARLSRRSLEDKQRILKDPNVGAFAVVMLAILFLLQFAAVYAVADGGQYLALLIAISVISRGLSSLVIFSLRHMPTSNYGAMLAQGNSVANKIFVVIVVLCAVMLSFLYAGAVALIVSAAVILGYAVAIRTVYKEFEGVSGDLLGYAMGISEVCGLIALALLQGVEVSL